MKYDRAKLRDNVNKYRKVGRQPYWAIAERCGLAHSTVYNFLNDEGSIAEDSIKKIGEWFYSRKPTTNQYTAVVTTEGSLSSELSLPIMSMAWCKGAEPTMSTRYNP